MQPVVPGSVDVSVHIRIIDSAAGTPETGVTSATSGLALSYRVGAAGALTALTESDLAAVTSSHSDGGMKHVDAGVYRVDVPDAAVPGSEGVVTWVGGTCTDMIVIPAAILGRVVPLAPTTAGRTLDVSAGGEAGVDWANVGSPTTAVGLSGTTVKTATDVATALTTVDGIVDDILVDTGTTLPASIAALPTASSIWSAITSAAANKIADHVLRRSWATAAASADGDTKSFRSLLGAVAKLVNRFAVVDTTATVYEADDTTALGTQTATVDADADHITALNTD